MIEPSKFFKSDVSIYFTSMYNDLTDVPPALAYLVTALKAKSKSGFELIDFSIDDD